MQLLQQLRWAPISLEISLRLRHIPRNSAMGPKPEDNPTSAIATMLDDIPALAALSRKGKSNS
jgi:hypothetical protein